MIDHSRLSVLTLAVLVACGGASNRAVNKVNVTEAPSFTAERGSTAAAEERALPPYAPAPAWSDADSPIPISSVDAMSGSRTAKVTIVTFSDFECPYCGRFDRGTLKQVREVYGNDQVRLVFKHMPLTSIHTHAMPMAIVSRAVFERGGSDAFFDLLHAAFANPQIVLKSTNAFDVPLALGLTPIATPSDVDLARYKAEVESDDAVAKKLGITGTPASFINGIAISGAQPFDKVAAIIDREIDAVNLLTDVPADRIYVERSKANHSPPKTEDAEPEDNTKVWKVPLGTAPIRGNKTGALVTIVEFANFECAFSAKVRPTLEKIRTQYKDDVRIAFRHLPLAFHKRARPAATLALEALAQKGNAGFWAAHDLLFDRTTPFEKLDFGDLAKQLGINVPRFEKAIADERWDDFLEDELALASRFQTNSTPHFFINGRRLSGAHRFERFEQIIDEELARARALQAKGVPVNKLYEKLIAGGEEPAEEPLEKKSVGAIPKTAPSKGPAGARVTIQIFSDFQCPFCSRVEPTLAKIEKRYRNRIRFVWRDLPLPFHQNAKPAANAAREAQKQQGNKGFWAMHDLLFENQKSLSRADLTQYATTQKLDLTKFEAALDASTYDPLIQADMDAAEAGQITGTPSFLINGHYMSGAWPFSKFRRVIELALAGK